MFCYFNRLTIHLIFNHTSCRVLYQAIHHFQFDKVSRAQDVSFDYSLIIQFFKVFVILFILYRMT